MAAGVANAANIRVMSSLATREAWLELVPQFEKSSGHRVKIDWVGSQDMMKRLRGGEVVDLVVLSASGIDELVKEGRLAAGSRVDLASSVIGVAVRAGARKPDLSSSEALKRDLLAAKSVGYSSGPSGLYLAGLFKKWGIPEAKITQTPPGSPVGDIIASGKVEIGFQQVSELLPIKGIDYVGPAPADIQLRTVFSAGARAAAEPGHRRRRPAAGPHPAAHGVLGRHSRRRDASGAGKRVDGLHDVGRGRTGVARQGS